MTATLVVIKNDYYDHKVAIIPVQTLEKCLHTPVSLAGRLEKSYKPSNGPHILLELLSDSAFRVVRTVMCSLTWY